MTMIRSSDFFQIDKCGYVRVNFFGWAGKGCVLYGIQHVSGRCTTGKEVEKSAFLLSALYSHCYAC